MTDYSEQLPIFYKKYRAKRYTEKDLGKKIIAMRIYETMWERSSATAKRNNKSYLFNSDEADKTIKQALTSLEWKDRFYGFLTMDRWLALQYYRAKDEKHLLINFFTACKNTITANAIFEETFSALRNFTPQEGQEETLNHILEGLGAVAFSGRLQAACIDFKEKIDNPKKYDNSYWRQREQAFSSLLIWIIAYNKTIELMAEEIKMPELLYLQVDTKPIEDTLQQLNTAIEEYLNLADKYYTDKDPNTHEAIVYSLFPGYPYAFPKMEEYHINDARQTLKGLNCFMNPISFDPLECLFGNG